MSLTENSRQAVFHALKELYPIATAKINMWSLSDIYKEPPMLLFRFKNIPKSHPAYTKLLDVVENFLGALKWTITTDHSYPNYLILPEIFVKFIRGTSDENNQEFVNTNGEFNALIDSAIEDAPKLASYIIENKEYIIG